MSGARSILNKHMLLIDVNSKQTHLPDKPYLYAFYLPTTGKVWLSKTRCIQRVIENLRRISTRRSVIDSFPKSVQSRLKDLTDTAVLLYISNPSILLSSSLVMDLENMGALLRTATKENKIVEVVWVITHKQTGHYKFVKTAEVDRSPRRVFETFVYSLKNSADGSRSQLFLKEHDVELSKISDYNVEVLIEAKSEREVNVAINKYVRVKGGELSLSVYGISKSALKD